jgi:hypothetical protein
MGTRKTPRKKLASSTRELGKTEDLLGLFGPIFKMAGLVALLLLAGLIGGVHGCALDWSRV